MTGRARPIRGIRLPRALLRLRVRLGLLLFAGFLFVGLGFDGLWVTLTRQWLVQELEVRSRTLTGQLASRVAVPLLLEDRVELEDQLAQANGEPDVVGVAVYRDSGREIVRNVRSPARWAEVPRPPLATQGRDSLTVRVHRARGSAMLEIVAPVRRPAGSSQLRLDEAGELAGIAPAPSPSPGHPERVGWVRMVVSTARIESAVAGTARVGLTLVLVALGLWLIPISAFMRITVRPLQEASQLAREIAGGNLNRRVPVRSDDELGALAVSLNSMASGLADAWRRAQKESDNLRIASEAVVATARGARAATGPHGSFEVVAPQVRRVTGCRGIALATSTVAGETMRFVQLDPPGPWGELANGTELDPAVALRLTQNGDAPLRLLLDLEDGPLGRALTAEDFRSALLVPLAYESGPPSVLMLAADRVDAFPPAQMDVVAGLATHLAAALRAAQLGRNLEHAFHELEATRNGVTAHSRDHRLRASPTSSTTCSRPCWGAPKSCARPRSAATSTLRRWPGRSRSSSAPPATAGRRCVACAISAIRGLRPTMPSRSISTPRSATRRSSRGRAGRTRRRRWAARSPSSSTPGPARW